jgi:TonB family protein
MRKLLTAVACVWLVPSVVGAQPPKHSMPAAILGDPGEWFGPDQYPKDALRAERQGRVIADVLVSVSGAALGCTIEVSSGTTSLDKATCDIALAHATFNPARDDKGRPIVSTFRLPVNWTLPDEIPAVEAKTATLASATEVQVTADEGGMGVSCRTVSRVGDVPDPCAYFKPGTRMARPYVRDGRPVGSTITFKTSSSITIDP